MIMMIRMETKRRQSRIPLRRNMTGGRNVMEEIRKML